ncbi:LytR/AlgR family response regulator transcription factor [Parahaliea aestuarii]|uniref:Response regulator transcription factor n=1 Tax=Parahaliea aestuarii TaxID=1852021 RepID=A0A5C8ZPW0_9GAMM|nr:LytTR family DNA-binding domain-containing protein [Parahaliea aestuarii]TXS90526.1 response regulator transcription factor [Parahaliea aestuarii]
MKVLIVDDEPLARERLQRLLARVRPEAECRSADSAESALALLRDFDAELLLLDVRMPGRGGLALAADLAAQEQPPAVIFCTAYDEYALDALRHQAVAYLLKPVREVELEQALNQAGRVNRAQVAALRGEAAPHRSQVSSQGHRGLETLPVAEIRCFLAEQKYVTAYAPQRELLLPDALKDLEQEFGEQFLRVHRNALVAVRFVRRLARDSEGWCVELEGVEQRPAVSRRHLAAVKERLLGR